MTPEQAYGIFVEASELLIMSKQNHIAYDQALVTFNSMIVRTEEAKEKKAQKAEQSEEKAST